MCSTSSSLTPARADGARRFRLVINLVVRFSGHSLRAGFVTSAAAVDVPPLCIAQHTRHKSLEMVNRHCREADKYSRSALKGIFRAATEEATP